MPGVTSAARQDRTWRTPTTLRAFGMLGALGFALVGLGAVLPVLQSELGVSPGLLAGLPTLFALARREAQPDFVRITFRNGVVLNVKSTSFAKETAEVRVVRKCVALLRVGDSLDRSHHQPVQRICVQVGPQLVFAVGGHRAFVSHTISGHSAPVSRSESDRGLRG